MARVVLATRAHRARTSAAPRSLEDLAPWFGDEGVPTDPATGGPFTLTAGAKGGWADLEADEVRSWGRSPVGGRALIPTGATTGKTVLGRLHVRVR